ncbi:MAG: hypothetical protein ACE5GC_04675 [Acidimicrobiia bacterium]
MDEVPASEGRRASLLGSIFTFGVEAAFVASLVVVALLLSAVIMALV